MSLRIAGLGTALPEHALPQVEAAELLVSLLPPGGRARTVHALYARSGIRRRHSVLLGAEGGEAPGQAFYRPAAHPADRGPTTAERMGVFEAEAPPLAARAAGRALDDAGLEARDVTHLVTVTCTGFFSPGLDAELVGRLGLRPSVQRTQVGFMGCHGALNGLRVAAAHAGADPRAVVLVCCVELCSLHLAYEWDANALVSNALFADGAAALVGVGDAAVLPGAGSRGRRLPAWRVDASGTFLVPTSAEAMTWRVGDHGFRMTLSARVPDLIRTRAAGWLGAWLAERGVPPGEVRTWAVHPGGPRVLSAFGEGAGLGPGAFAVSREVLAEHGNMSSATLLFILERLRRDGAPTPLVALAFGPGLVVEAALVV